MKLLEGKVALITGAGRGIGKAVAMRFAEQGADIAFTDLELSEGVLATQEELEKFGVRVKAYASNAADFEQGHAVVEQIIPILISFPPISCEAFLTWIALFPSVVVVKLLSGKSHFCYGEIPSFWVCIPCVFQSIKVYAVTMFE